MKRVKSLSHARLMEVLDYDPASGAFAWKVSTSNRIKVGDRAGAVGTNGYRLIVVDGIRLQASRLAWFYVHREWPRGDVVPLNGDVDDVRIDNLCDQHRVLAARARGVIATNTSGFRGVSKSSTSGKWQARITWQRHQVNLGNKFATAEDASEIYEEASRRLLMVASASDLKDALTELQLWRRQRTAWREIERSHPGHQWQSFESFCAIVKEVPRKRWAMVPVDVKRPIGPDNFRWSVPVDLDAHSLTPEYRKIRNEATKEHLRSRQMQRDYGIDAAVYARMLADQRGVCAICEKPETKIQDGVVRQLSVDHDHKTGDVRGLLCSSCNQGLGYFCDDVGVMQRAIGYLRKGSGDVVKFEPAVVAGALSSGA